MLPNTEILLEFLFTLSKPPLITLGVKELNISPVGRVEGDLDVKVYIDDGKVTRAHTQAAMFRGFEKIMEGKDPQSGLIVTPRICGICGGSHLYCASSALDTAWGTKLTPNALLLRAIGQATETIQSIPRWFYAIFATDLANKKWRGRLLVRSSSNSYNQALMSSIVANLGSENTTEWSKGVVANFARNPKGNDRDQVKAIAAGQGDIAIVNSYYIGLLLSSENDEQEDDLEIPAFLRRQKN